MISNIKTRSDQLLGETVLRQTEEEFHARMEATGDLTGVLQGILHDYESGLLDERSASEIFSEAIFMSLPVYPIGWGKEALEAIADPLLRERAEERFASLHQQLSTPPAGKDRPDLDPLRYLYETVDVSLLREIAAAGDRDPVLHALRMQVTALAEHLHRCQYLSQTSLSSRLLTRIPPNRALELEEMRALAEFSNRVIASVSRPGPKQTLREVLNERTENTKRQALRQQRSRSRLGP